jgi:murein DD-endopeptidase MepM/ murein hydrolase activator NlpD
MANKKSPCPLPAETQEDHIPPDRGRMRTSVIVLSLLTILLGYGTLRGIYYQQQTKLLQAASTNQICELQARKEALNRELTEIKIELAKIIQEKEKLASLKQNQEELLEGSISKLDEQAKAIEKVIDQLGVKVKIEEDPAHSGGPYIATDENFQDKLIITTDRYLTALQSMPLGYPVNTKISSRFGKRVDPINGKIGFHSGIDFKGDTGDKVAATGNGVVKKTAYNKGLGNYVVISHGHGYETTFAHLSRQLVKKGQKIDRGRTIGLVGNTGRSTGSHLHYEIRLNGKPINPAKYINISNLTVIASK